MRMFELLPRPLGIIFRKLTHLTCNSSFHMNMLGGEQNETSRASKMRQHESLAKTRCKRFEKPSLRFGGAAGFSNVHNALSPVSIRVLPKDSRNLR